MTFFSRPGSLVAMSISVASMRPLPLTKPAPGPEGLKAIQTTTAIAATTTMAAAQMSTFFFSRCWGAADAVGGAVDAVGGTVDVAGVVMLLLPYSSLK
jgi:hypothetical protein